MPRKVKGVENKRLKKLVSPEWEAQPGESQKAFAAFSRYLRMGDNRSYLSLAIMLDKCKADDDEKTVYNARTAIGVMANNYRWNERVKAYDNHMNKLFIKEEVESKRRKLKRHEKLLEASEKVLTIPIQDALKRLASGELKLDHVFKDNFSSVDEKRLNLARKHAESLLKVINEQRKSIGEPTEILKGDITSGGKPIKVIIPKIPEPPDTADDE